MVVLAQLVEHRIVVPSVVGSSPTFHPNRCKSIDYSDFFMPFFGKHSQYTASKSKKNDLNIRSQTSTQ